MISAYCSGPFNTYPLVPLENGPDLPWTDLRQEDGSQNPHNPF
jgi:hypothetical protein